MADAATEEGVLDRRGQGVLRGGVCFSYPGTTGSNAPKGPALRFSQGLETFPLVDGRVEQQTDQNKARP